MHFVLFAAGAIALGTLAASAMLLWDRRLRAARGAAPIVRAERGAGREPAAGGWGQVAGDLAGGRGNGPHRPARRGSAS